jgi:uncharacterized RDD family membrane protein YckC
MIAFLIDIVLILAIAAIVRLTLQALLGFFTNILPFFHLNERDVGVQATGFAGASLFQLVYFVFFWTAIGQTVGMSLMGLSVMRPDGTRPPVLRSLVRYFGYWLCFISLGLGFLWILFDRQRRGWHDKLSGTLVVYSSEARLYHQRIVAARGQEHTAVARALSDTVTK